MKVLQLGKFYPIRGGVEKVMWDLTRGLSERGVTCDMLCARLRGRSVIPFGPNGRVICVPALFKMAATMISPAMIRWVRRHASQYDIIHIHHPDPMAALALRLSGYKGKVVLHWHSDILSQRLFLLFYRPLQSWLIRRADRIIGTSPVYVKNSSYLAKIQEKCTVVPIGIAPVPENPVRTRELRSRFAGKTLLLGLGRLVPYKGFRHLVAAMSLLPEDYVLVIGGEGPLRGELEELIVRKGLEERVSMIGYVPDADVPAWLRACDIFVLPSIMKTEAFGIVQIEAMSCGKPVVATTIPGSGVSWVNSEGVSGVNVTPRDSDALAAAIQEVRGRAAELGAGAHELFLKRYTLDAMIDKVMEIYAKESDS